jgi:hypothetical protein
LGIEPLGFLVAGGLLSIVLEAGNRSIPLAAGILGVFDLLSHGHLVVFDLADRSLRALLVEDAVQSAGGKCFLKRSDVCLTGSKIKLVGVEMPGMSWLRAILCRVSANCSCKAAR